MIVVYTLRRLAAAGRRSGAQSAGGSAAVQCNIALYAFRARWHVSKTLCTRSHNTVCLNIIIRNAGATTTATPGRRPRGRRVCRGTPPPSRTRVSRTYTVIMYAPDSRIIPGRLARDVRQSRVRRKKPPGGRISSNTRGEPRLRRGFIEVFYKKKTLNTKIRPCLPTSI